MTGVNELNDQLEGVTVIKRNGKKVDFDGAKIDIGKIYDWKQHLKRCFQTLCSKGKIDDR